MQINCDKEMNSILQRCKVQSWTVLVLLSIVLSFAACDEENENNNEPTEEYPSLKVVNQLNYSISSIIKVSLVGYEFNNLNIPPSGGSQSFILDKGMPGGYNDINVTVMYIRYSGVNRSTSIKVNFSNGKTTTITLKGCDGAEGCPGIYLEATP